MTDKELLELYDSCCESEFFESIDDPDQLERLLGKSVANEYANWIYLNIK